MEGKKYAVIDLEMCRVAKEKRKEVVGLRNEIIEIGAVLLDESFSEVDSFKSYVSPQYGAVDAFINKLTGITEEDTKDAPTVEEALIKFSEWLPEDAVLVSWSKSDESQLRRELEYKGIHIPKFEKYILKEGVTFEEMDTWQDCQQDFSEKLDSPKVYNLREALIIADIDFDENIHDALIDARNTALLFKKIQTEEELKTISYYVTEDESGSGLLGGYTHA